MFIELAVSTQRLFAALARHLLIISDMDARENLAKEVPLVAVLPDSSILF